MEEGEHFRPPIARRVLRCRKIAKKETCVEINCVRARLMFFLLTLGSACAPLPPSAAFEGSRAALLYGTYLYELPARSARLHKKSHYADVGEQFSVLDCSLLLRSPVKLGLMAKRTNFSFAKLLAQIAVS
jgi:hypothetical protein